MSEDIGTGLTFTLSGFTGQIVNVSEGGEEIPVIDFAHMGSTGYREKKFGQLKEPPQLTIEFNYDPANRPAVGLSGSATLTWPDGATLIGTGAIISREGEYPLEDKMTGTFVFQFDGQTGPTFDDGES